MVYRYSHTDLNGVEIQLLAGEAPGEAHPGGLREPGVRREDAHGDGRPAARRNPATHGTGVELTAEENVCEAAFGSTGV